MNVEVAFKQHKQNQTLLENTKAKLMLGMKKLEIYEIECNDFNSKFIGQSRKVVKTWFQEQFSHVKYGKTEKSSIAQVMVW